MRLIFDANSYLNEALLRGTDHDNGKVVLDEAGKQHQVNSADYGVQGFFDKLLQVLQTFDAAPRQCVLVWDGMNAKLRRRTYLPTYKAGRDKIPEVSEQLNMARDKVNALALDLGMHIVYQDGLEADDVIGYLAKMLRDQRNVIVTSDGDLAVLVDENTDVWAKGELNRNPFGMFPHKYITVYKSLVGDKGDKIPGAKGFGDSPDSVDSAWVKLVRVFGLEGLDAMLELIENGELDRLREDVADLPVLQKIIDDKAGVTTSWRCARLLTDEVNTMRRPMSIRAGMVKQWAELADENRVHELKKFYGTKTLVTAANYAKARERVANHMEPSPFVALDIETSTGEESDEWIQRRKALTDSDKVRMDVLGHELTGMSLTFGDNTQHTIYMSVDHADTDNITVDQCREMVELIPRTKRIVIQNRQFEFSVLYRTWGEKWKNNGWHGMVPNAIDTKVGAAYVDENMRRGLKERSLHHLGYKQATYEETTRFSGPVGTLHGGQVVKEFDVTLVPAEYTAGVPATVDEETGEILTKAVKSKLISDAVTEAHETREYKMKELPATHVFDYGCDDTICTAALATHYQFIMELEHTWGVYLDVETLPEYLTTLAYVQGVPISLAKLRAMEAKDEARYEAGWVTLRTFLLKHGWAGTICPEFEGDIEPADAKMAVEMLVSEEFTTKKRKLNAIAADIREQCPDNALAELLANIVERNDVEALNSVMKEHFDGEPKINFNSPKQMQNLFYRVIGIRPRIFNTMTDNQRTGNEDMVEAFKKLRRARDAKADLFSLTETVDVQYEYKGKTKTAKLTPLTAEEREALISKASTDDVAVDWALKKDPITDEQRAVLKAFKDVKTVLTRRGLFYKPYKSAGHWRDGNIHPSMNQSEAVTLRYSSSDPNAQQMPKRGEGVEFREVIQPHMKDAVVVSLDFNGQELRSIAEQSGDANLTACYVGDDLKDVHSLTAVAAAVYLWDQEVEYSEFLGMLSSEDKSVAKKAKDLRGDAKTVNFGTNYDLQAPGLAEQLFVEVEVAQAFIDAKDVAMPGIGIWKEDVREFAEKYGFVTTLMGARRHLRDALMSDNKWEATKAGRQGPNFKIQASSAEQTKMALASMWRRGIFTGKYRARFYFPVHDEVVFSVHKDDAVACIRDVHECMTQPYGGMTIPIVSSISLGLNFGQQIEVGGDEMAANGDYVDETRIRAALEKLYGVAA